MAQTITSGNGLEALKLFENESPDLVLLDIMLPGLDGIQVCRALRQKGVKTPIILVSARDRDIDKAYGIGTGAGDHKKSRSVFLS